MSERTRPPPACVQDADESGNIIEDTRRYASSAAPASPSKERSNVSRPRREKKRSESSPLINTHNHTDSDSTVHPQALKKAKERERERDRDRDREREKAVSPTTGKKQIMSSSRPATVKHSKTTPAPRRQAESGAYFGVEPPAVTPATGRPRAKSRPSSYYGSSSKPPLANARWHSQTPGPNMHTSFPGPWGPPPPGPPPPVGLPGPPPMPYPQPSPSPIIMQGPPMPPLPPHPDYHRPLESRFGSYPRPQSALSFRPPPQQLEYEYEEPHMERSLVRRPSTNRKLSKLDDERDRNSMPPPRRPQSARPNSVAFAPPPATPAARRRGGGFDEELEEAPFFSDLSPLPAYEYGTLPFRPRGRAPSIGATDFTYEPEYETEIAGRYNRRNSYYGGGEILSTSSGSNYEDQVRAATRYQDDAIGGPSLPLTTESLRKVRNGGSSRSTRSSGSHDESEYRTATTRTTHTSNNDEDVTIRVKGNTVLKVGGAEMQCHDGAEINIISRGGAGLRIGSDRSSYLDHDDRETRIDMPHSRSKSRTRSFSRPAFARYEPSPIDYDGYAPDPYARPALDSYAPPPLPPPYPAYPTLSSSYSQRDDYFGSPS